MPPLPSLRCSPTTEPRSENSHKRVRSFESGLTLKTKDDDLMLFNEMQNRDRDNFLLQKADDFEDSLSKLRHFSSFKLGISIPARGESSDLLNVEGDKNDYDWLLTPPDTPLFTSLDDDDPQPVNLVSRGRPRSQPIMISRSLTDKSYQSSRTSSSPHRLSPSPRSSGTLAQMRGRPSSVPRSSPPPVIRSPTPTRRPCTPNKPSTPTSMSSTPTLRRMSTSSDAQSSNYGGRGASPVKASRGNSASPKLRGWQTTLSGFNSEAPPNLRTSLSDRPVSHIRGSSPARNGRESSVSLGRKSLSPTSSRSIRSSHSQERDRFSKGSVVSSGDDNESLHSIKMGISRSPPSKKDGALTNNKATVLSRKPYRTSPSNSVPKRSFDSALRLMDHRKPQNMFRPLLSSVPATTFRPIFSRNSSLTTSSNASSEQGVISFAPDVEVCELEHNDLPGGWVRTEDSDTHEEVFLFDKVDEIIEDTSQVVLPAKHQSHDEDFGEILINKIDSEDIQNRAVSICDATSSTTPFESAYCADNHCEVDRYPMVACCCKCGKEFNIVDANGNRKLCKHCAEEDGLSTSGISLACTPFTKSEVLSRMNFAVGATSKGLLNSGVSEFHEEGNVNVKICQHGRNNELGTDCLAKICSIQLLDQNESQLSDMHVDRKKDVNVTVDCRDSTPQPSNHAVNSSLKVDIPEGTGISVLLQRSGSSKWPILQGKTLSATNFLCSEPPYSRDNTNALRRSLGRDNASASSSIDLGSSRQSETYVHHQLSLKNEAENVRNDINSTAQSMNSDNDASVSSYKSRHLRSECEEKIISSAEFLGYDPSREIMLVTEEHADSSDQSHFNTTPSSMPIISENYMSEHSDDCRAGSKCEPQILSHQRNNNIPLSSETEIMCEEDCISSIHADEDPQDNGINAQIEKTTDFSVCSEMEEDYIMVDSTLQNDILNAATNCSSNVNIESRDGCNEFEDSHNPAYPVHSNGHSIPKTSENDLSTSESITTIHEHGEAAIMVEGPRGHMSRSLTLEEATDTILFCSSIIHDLAYKAATIAMEKELEVLPEPLALYPAVTLGKPIPDLRESGKLPNIYKYSPRSQKFKRKRLEAQTTSPPKEVKEVENDVNVQELTTSKAEIPRKVDSAKPPKLESKCNCTVM